MLVTVEDGVATGIRGDPQMPFTEGTLCTKVAHYLERTYAPDRLTFPQKRIGKKGDILTLARESLVSITRLSSFHQTSTGADPKSVRELKQELKVLQRDAAALSDHAAFLNSKINFLLDATLGLINLEQNQIIKIFSVAAVVFLPPTLVASVYGMNFDAMPELHLPFGYPLALVLMVISAVLPYLFFKRKGWL